MIEKNHGLTIAKALILRHDDVEMPHLIFSDEKMF